MFNPNHTLISAFTEHLLDEFRGMFPDALAEYERALQQSAQTALQTLLNCDCPYHDLQHTLLVTDVGQAILQGRQLARGDVTEHDWLHATIAMLFHDVGYLRQLLPQDTEDASVINSQGELHPLPSGITDAYMTPYHVTRGAMFVAERFANDQTIDTSLVAQCIEMTRFPVPEHSAYQADDTLPALVRAADLIGQMADPQYLQKLPRLHAELVEIGEHQRWGYQSARDLRDRFPDFFYANVHPYIGSAVAYLKRTQTGQQWVANLYHHLHVSHLSHDADPKIRAPELVVDNR